MPKANETKKVKLTAEADTKKEEKVTEVKAAERSTTTKEEESKTAAKAAEIQNPAEAAEPKAPAAKKSATKKAASAEKSTAVKKTADKAGVRKETAKPGTAKPEDAPTATTKANASNSKKVTESVWIQYAGREIEVSDILEKAKAAYAGDAKKMTDIRVYVKPEENKAYFVVNGDETGCVAL